MRAHSLGVFRLGSKRLQAATFDAFSSRELVSTSLENAPALHKPYSADDHLREAEAGGSLTNSACWHGTCTIS